MRFEVTRVVRENARTILRELMAHDYHIVHLAGHGVFDYPVEENLDCARNARAANASRGASAAW